MNGLCFRIPSAFYSAKLSFKINPSLWFAVPHPPLPCLRQPFSRFVHLSLFPPAPQIAISAFIHAGQFPGTQWKHSLNSFGNFPHVDWQVLTKRLLPIKREMALKELWCVKSCPAKRVGQIERVTLHGRMIRC